MPRKKKNETPAEPVKAFAGVLRFSPDCIAVIGIRGTHIEVTINDEVNHKTYSASADAEEVK